RRRVELRLRAAAGARDRAERTGGGMTTVLVVDDEAPIRLLCRVNLEAEDMKVLEAANGDTGLEMARAEHPDVVLLDVMMPGRSGWEVAEELLADDATSGIPIVFLAAREIGGDQGGGRQAAEGADRSGDADPAHARIEQVRAVRRAGEPIGDRHVGRHDAARPGEVLLEQSPANVKPGHPSTKVAV